MSGEPFPKAQQLARGERRYRRKVASAKQWQRIADEKHGPCRICCVPARNGGHSAGALIELHHIIKRGAPYFGDDVADNIVPLCRPCHEQITRRSQAACLVLVTMLTDAERAYCIAKLGEGWIDRLFRVVSR